MHINVKELPSVGGLGLRGLCGAVGVAFEEGGASVEVILAVRCSSVRLTIRE